MTTAITTNETKNDFGLLPKSFEQAERLAKIIASSDFAPKEYKNKPQNVLIAVQMGAEVGLKPMQAIQNISIINGKPCVYGDAMLALVKAHQDCEWIAEEFDDATKTATCKVKRKNNPVCERTFSLQEAKIAGLEIRPVWKLYQKRMLQMRARGFALRDSFPDALQGLNSAEEVQDYKIIDTKAEVEIIEKTQNNKASTAHSEKANNSFDDLNSAHPSNSIHNPIKRINQEQLRQLQDSLELHEVDLDKLYQYCKIDNLKDLPDTRFKEILMTIRKKPLKTVEKLTHEVKKPETIDVFDLAKDEETNPA